MSKYTKGKVVRGTITCIEPYGAFMSFDEYYTGLIHISEISKGFVKDIHDFVNVGDHIYVEILEVDEPQEYLDKIKIGKDGLIIQKGFSRGLLLPQVATENNMNVEEFLEHTCMKAGISSDSWLDASCDVYTFQGQIFK